MIALDIAAGAPARRTGRPRFLAVAAGLWAVPVLATLTDAGPATVVLLTTIAAALCAAAILQRPQRALIALPFFALLSPMTGLLDVGGAQVVYSDLLFLLLLVQAMLVVVPRLARGAPSRNSKLFVSLATLYVVSVMIGLAQGYLLSAKPLMYLLQLAIIFVYTATYVRSPESWLDVMRSWLTATAFGSLILLQAYAAGRNLDNLKEGDLVPGASPADLLSLFRATYYYSGVHYILGLCIVWLVTRLFFKASLRARMLQITGLLLAALALTAMVNKTAMAAVALAIVLTTLLLFLRFRQEMLKAVLWMAVFCSVGAIVLGWQYYQLSQDTQVDMIVDRLGSASSLQARFEVYAQAMDLWASSPSGVAIGFGPDFLDNSGNPTYAIPMKTSKETGYEEGTVDSAWLSYAIELGLPGVMLLALVFRRGFLAAARGLRSAVRLDSNAYAAATVLGGLSYLAIAMATQMLGYSKTSWLPFQVVFVSLLVFMPKARALEPRKD
jgi:hypothetical protein